MDTLEHTDAAAEDAADVVEPLVSHARARSMVLPKRRVVFVPMPKAGCTSILWTLGQLGGVSPDHLGTSLTSQVSQVMTIHDVSLWPERLRWAALSDEERAAINADDSWLRFTVVRDPARRLFSAWQSKLLMREPQYVRRYADADWFPRIPRWPAEIIEDFRRFVLSLAEPDDAFPVDVHWAPQSDVLVDAPHLNHVGHTEQMDLTLRRLRNHVGPAVDKVKRRRENRTLLGYSPGLYDEETAAVVNTFYAADFEAFGYQPVDGDQVGRLATWRGDVKPVLPALAELVERHERIGVLTERTKRLRQRTWELGAELRELRPEPEPEPESELESGPEPEPESGPESESS